MKTRFTRTTSGKYSVNGKHFEMLIGSRAQVMHGTAYKTSGGLKKDDIMMNKNGRIVSRKKHVTASKEKRLVKAGYLTKKGHFGFVKTGSRHHSTRKHGRRSRKMRGGFSEYPNNGMLLGGGNHPTMPESFASSASASSGGGRRRHRRRFRGGAGMPTSTPSLPPPTLPMNINAHTTLPPPPPPPAPMTIQPPTTAPVKMGGGRSRRGRSRRYRGGASPFDISSIVNAFKGTPAPPATAPAPPAPPAPTKTGGSRRRRRRKH